LMHGYESSKLDRNLVINFSKRPLVHEEHIINLRIGALTLDDRLLCMIMHAFITSHI
jgi:hypothetical protein